MARTFSDLLEKLGRGIFENPFGANANPAESPEVAEIRFAILDQVKSKMERSGGKLVFPYNRVRVHVRGVQESQSAIFKNRFFTDYFQQEIRAALEKASCRLPDDLDVQVDVSREFPAAGTEWITVTTESVERPAPARVAARQRRTARLTVMQGKANVSELTVARDRVNIGRVVDVYRSEGIVRRNDLAFSEESEINRTVSREHAHILYDKESGEYRLHNDRWYKRDAKADGNCNLWIVRDGLSQEVHRDGRGTRLQSGDEIRCGKAAIRFVMK